MRSARLLFSFLILNLVLGCKPVLYLVYDIHKPKVLSIKQIENAAIKYGFSQNSVYALSDSSFLRFIQNNEVVNDIHIYNKNGYRILPKDTISCSGQKINMLSIYKNSDSIYIDSSSSMLQTFGEVILVKQVADSVFYNPKVDYSIIVTFADFTGKLNKQNSKPWVDAANALKPQNTLIAVISIDPIKPYK